MIEPITPDDAIGEYRHGDVVFPVVNDLLAERALTSPNGIVVLQKEITDEVGDVSFGAPFINAYTTAGWHVEETRFGWRFSFSKGQS